jgi:branched-chain amino acid aminotransferase
MSLSKGKNPISLLAWEWNNGYLADKMKIMTSVFNARILKPSKWKPK